MRRLACLALVPLLIAACTGKTLPGAGIMVTMRTDLKVPANVDVVGVYIARLAQSGTVDVISSTEVQAEYTGDDGQKHVVLPGTLAIESDHDPETRIRVRVVAYDVARRPVAMREARLFVPTADLKALPMPLLWMNTDDVADSTPDGAEPDPILGDAKVVTPTRAGVDAFARFKSDFCGDDMTLDDTGACRTIQVEVDSLDTYVDPASDLARGILDGEVATGTSSGAPDFEGGGDGTRTHAFCARDQLRPCFDAIGCFPSGETDPNFFTLEVTPDQIAGDGKACTVSLASIAANVPGGMSVTDVALAVKTSAAEGATCTETGSCVIPLDVSAGTKLDPAAQTVALPPGVCRKAKKTGSTVLSIVASPICKPKQVDEPICRTADGAAATGSAVCHDGSGWNGQQDPPPPAEPDGGSHDGGSTDLCQTLPRASGFWVEPTRITLIDRQAHFFVAQQPKASGSCLTSGFGSDFEFGGDAPVVPLDQPYRLYGATHGTESLVSFAASTAPGAAGLVRFDAAGVPALRRVDSTATVTAGAFVELPSSDGYFATSDGTFRTSLGSAAGKPFDTSTNLVVRDEGTTSATVCAVTSVLGAVHLLDCTVQKGTSSVACADLAPTTSIPDDTTPIALAKSSTGTLYALAARGTTASVLAVDPTIPSAAELTTLATDGGIPSSMTLALTASGPLRGYFASQNAFYRVDLSAEPAVIESVQVSDAASYQAVQIVGSRLYWLETDQAGNSSLQVRTLTPDGLIAP